MHARVAHVPAQPLAPPAEDHLGLAADPGPGTAALKPVEEVEAKQAEKGEEEPRHQPNAEALPLRC